MEMKGIKLLKRLPRYCSNFVEALFVMTLKIANGFDLRTH